MFLAGKTCYSLNCANVNSEGTLDVTPKSWTDY